MEMQDTGKAHIHMHSHTFRDKEIDMQRQIQKTKRKRDRQTSLTPRGRRCSSEIQGQKVCPGSGSAGLWQLPGRPASLNPHNKSHLS